MSDSVIELSFDRGTLLLGGINAWEGWTLDPRIGCLRGDGIDYLAARQTLQKAFGNRFRDAVRMPARVAWRKVDIPAAKRKTLALFKGRRIVLAVPRRTVGEKSVGAGIVIYKTHIPAEDIVAAACSICVKATGV